MTTEWKTLEDYTPAAVGEPVVAKADGRRVVVVDTGKELRGRELACPHLKAPMTKGILMGAGTMIRCPKHNFIFRLKDGKGVNCVGLNLKTYAIREEQGKLEIALEAKSTALET